MAFLVGELGGDQQGEGDGIVEDPLGPLALLLLEIKKVEKYSFVSG